MLRKVKSTATLSDAKDQEEISKIEKLNVALATQKILLAEAEDYYINKITHQEKQYKDFIHIQHQQIKLLTQELKDKKKFLDIPPFQGTVQKVKFDSNKIKELEVAVEENKKENENLRETINLQQQQIQQMLKKTPSNSQSNPTDLIQRDLSLQNEKLRKDSEKYKQEITRLTNLNSMLEKNLTEASNKLVQKESTFDERVLEFKNKENALDKSMLEMQEQQKQFLNDYKIAHKKVERFDQERDAWKKTELGYQEKLNMKNIEIKSLQKKIGAKSTFTYELLIDIEASQKYISPPYPPTRDNLSQYIDEIQSFAAPAITAGAYLETSEYILNSLLCIYNLAEDHDLGKGKEGVEGKTQLQLFLENRMQEIADQHIQSYPSAMNTFTDNRKHLAAKTVSNLSSQIVSTIKSTEYTISQKKQKISLDLQLIHKMAADCNGDNVNLKLQLHYYYFYAEYSYITFLTNNDQHDIHLAGELSNLEKFTNHLLNFFPADSNLIYAKGLILRERAILVDKFHPEDKSKLLHSALFQSYAYMLGAYFYRKNEHPEFSNFCRDNTGFGYTGNNQLKIVFQNLIPDKSNIGSSSKKQKEQVKTSGNNATLFSKKKKNKKHPLPEAQSFKPGANNIYT